MTRLRILLCVIVVVGIFSGYSLLFFGGIPYRLLLNRMAGVSEFPRRDNFYNLEFIKLGEDIPFGPGDGTFAPYLTIPDSQKFYVSVAIPNQWCSNEDCGLVGALVRTMDGWLEVNNTAQPEVAVSFGLDQPDNKTVSSVVIIGDSQGKVIGIYPQKGLDDILEILKLFPKLADFESLKGVQKYGMLEVGKMAPLKPGDNISFVSEELRRKQILQVPKNKKFYLYGIQKNKYPIVGMYEKSPNEYICLWGGCRYPEPDPPHDFMFAQIEDWGGWFLVNDEKTEKMVALFGLKQSEVLAGEKSLLVLTDSDGKVLSLHPGKTMADAYTVLSQHPEIINLENIF